MSEKDFLAELSGINFAVGTQEIGTKESGKDDPEESISLEDTLEEIKYLEAASDQATSKKEEIAQPEADSKEVAAQVDITKTGLIEFLPAQGSNTTSDASTSDLFKESPGFLMYNEPCTAPSLPESPQTQEKKSMMSDEGFLAEIPVNNSTSSSQEVEDKKPEAGDPKASTSQEDTLEMVENPEAASEQATSKKAFDGIAPTEVDFKDAAEQEDKLKKESGDSLVAPEGNDPKSDAPQQDTKEFKEPAAQNEPIMAPISPEPTRAQKRKLRRVIVSRFPTRTRRGKARQDSDEDQPLAQIAGSSYASEPKPKKAKHEKK